MRNAIITPLPMAFFIQHLDFPARSLASGASLCCTVSVVPAAVESCGMDFLLCLPFHECYTFRYRDPVCCGRV
jgi:hypothetical protein